MTTNHPARQLAQRLADAAARHHPAPDEAVEPAATPPTGKTTWLSRHVLDHPGPVVSTSTKPDLSRSTAAIRASSDDAAGDSTPDTERADDSKERTS